MINIYLFRLITKWFGVICLSILSVFGNNIKEDTLIVENIVVDSTTPVVSIITQYDTIKKYNNKLPSGETRVLVQGSDGIKYVDSTGIEKELRPVVNEIIEIGTGPKSSYVGNTTGYGADCIGCSGVVACKTREGNYHHLVNDGPYYNDSQYGSVRILASDHRVFPCGTIIVVDNGREEAFLGIVLDTGIDMRKNWELYGLIHLDVAFVTEKDPKVYSMTASHQSAKFEVKRWGW
ncbi:MAG: hypothetical protein E7165_02480 [Firmicutes bacterium]|nr:hypothetical protein [Bacillota bacterium]